MARSTSCVVVLLCLSAAGRENQAPDRSIGGSVNDSAGVQLVHNGSGPHQPMFVPISEELRIGSIEGAPEQRLDLVAQILVDPADTMYVLLRRASEIRVFAGDGQYVRTIGRRGEGPGEFMSPVSMLLAGDSLLVSDSELSRATLFGTGGEVLETWPQFRMGAESLLTLSGWIPGAYLVDVIERISPEQGQTIEQTARLQFVPPTPDALEVADRRASSATAGDRSIEYSRGRFFGLTATSYTIPLWEPREYWAVDAAGRVHFARLDEYRIDTFDNEARLIRRVRRSHDPVPLTASLKQRLLAEASAHYDTLRATGASDGGASTSTPLDNLRRRLEWSGDRLPALGRVIASRDGELLVERPDLIEDPLALVWPPTVSPWLQRPSHWDLFDSAGAFAGTVRLPPRFTPHALGRDWLVGVLRDDLGVEYVVRYRVERPG